ncbi:MAG: hypothetical protein RBT65_03250 [Methanolobus sp.]|jgi:hypothetical protein|nr:hypothetical protein [Methanolobus sp.]
MIDWAYSSSENVTGAKPLFGSNTLLTEIPDISMINISATMNTSLSLHKQPVLTDSPLPAAALRCIFGLPFSRNILPIPIAHEHR